MADGKGRPWPHIQCYESRFLACVGHLVQPTPNELAYRSDRKKLQPLIATGIDRHATVRRREPCPDRWRGPLASNRIFDKRHGVFYDHYNDTADVHERTPPDLKPLFSFSLQPFFSAPAEIPYPLPAAHCDPRRRCHTPTMDKRIGCRLPCGPEHTHHDSRGEFHCHNHRIHPETTCQVPVNPRAAANPED